MECFRGEGAILIEGRSVALVVKNSSGSEEGLRCLENLLWAFPSERNIEPAESIPIEGIRIITKVLHMCWDFSVQALRGPCVQLHISLDERP